MEMFDEFLKDFNEYSIWREDNAFLLSDEQIAELNTSEEIKEAVADQRLHLCDLLSRERELLHYKEKYMRAIYLLERKHIRLFDDGC